MKKQVKLKIRSKNELLDMIIDYIQENLNSLEGNYVGLCSIISKLYHSNRLINVEEHNFLHRLIYHNIREVNVFMPRRVNKKILNKYTRRGFFWKPGNIKRRLKYLEYLKTI